MYIRKKNEEINIIAEDIFYGKAICPLTLKVGESDIVFSSLSLKESLLGIKLRTGFPYQYLDKSISGELELPKFETIEVLDEIDTKKFMHYLSIIIADALKSDDEDELLTLKNFLEKAPKDFFNKSKIIK